MQWLRTSLRDSVINLESLVVVHELEPAINLALYGVLWSLGIQYICVKFFSLCCTLMSNTSSNVVAWVCIISSTVRSWVTYVELRFVLEFMPSSSNVYNSTCKQKWCWCRLYPQEPVRIYFEVLSSTPWYAGLLRFYYKEENFDVANCLSCCWW